MWITPRIAIRALLIFWISNLAIHAQITLIHEFTSNTFITVEDGNTETPDFSYFANETAPTSAINADRIQLNFSNDYTFQQVSVTPGWQYIDTADGSDSITRTYFFGGLDGGLTNENFYFESPFELNFSLLKTDPGQTETSHTLNYNIVTRIYNPNAGLAVGGPSGSFSTTLIDPYAVPEPSTYALIIGTMVLLPVIWFRIRKK